MAFRKKARAILAHQPDILIVPECECPGRLRFDNETQVPEDIFWFGANPNKGLGVFSYSDFRFSLHPSHNAALKNILPLIVKGHEFEFMLFAIWANNPQDRDGAYVTQVWKAIHYYDELISDNRTILVGDFNSNTIWDKPHRDGNHSTVVEKLRAKKIFSAYHNFFRHPQGQEPDATLFMYRHHDKSYHIDYCFASEDFLGKMTKVEVGQYDYWKAYSDHAPLIVTFDLGSIQ